MLGNGGATVENYVPTVAIINFLFDFLLILGTNRLCGCLPGVKRGMVAAVVGGVYAGGCLLPGFGFLGSPFWRIVSLLVMGWIAFGWEKSGVRRTAIFSLLCMAMGGAAAGIDAGGVWSLVLAAVCVLALSFVGLPIFGNGTSYVPVELVYDGKRICLTALRDTGNTLRDPVTGGAVLVIGADAAKELTGLTQQQLKDPVAAMTTAQLPGLRLIPYKTVGQSAGMLLALRIPEMKIGAWHGSGLVAFAPEGLGSGENYQALTGGAA